MDDDRYFWPKKEIILLEQDECSLRLRKPLEIILEEKSYNAEGSIKDVITEFQVGHYFPSCSEEDCLVKGDPAKGKLYTQYPKEEKNHKLEEELIQKAKDNFVEKFKAYADYLKEKRFLISEKYDHFMYLSRIMDLGPSEKEMGIK